MRVHGAINPYARSNPRRVLEAALTDELPEHTLPETTVDRLLDLAFNETAAECNEVLSLYYAEAVAAHAKLLQKAPAYQRRAQVRLEVADYLDRVAGELRNPDYYKLAAKLRNARKWAVWGIDTGGELMLQWDGRAGLVKLCPDDAREEGRRITEQYVPALETLAIDGCELRYCVFTLPNAPRGDLKKTVAEIFDRFNTHILRAKKGGGTVQKLDDPRRRFPGIIGALATVEAPLSKDGDWNVHLNVLLVSRGRPDYKLLREAWGFNVHFDYIRGRKRDALRAGLAEIVKYTVQAVSSKSKEKADGGWTAAPGLTQWPAADFDEWHRAHYRLRRTRSWGCLYGIEKPEGRDATVATWVGKAVFDAANGNVLRVSAPVPDSRTPAERADDWCRLDSIQGDKSRDFVKSRARDGPRAAARKLH